MDPDIGVDDPPDETAHQYSLVLLAPRRSDASALRRGLRRAAKAQRVEQDATREAGRGKPAVGESGTGDRPGKSEIGEGTRMEPDVDASRNGSEARVAESTPLQPLDAVSGDGDLDAAAEQTAETHHDQDAESGEQAQPTAIVVRTGVGPRRSRRAVRDDHIIIGKAIAVAGIGRALADRVQPGDVVVADQVRTDALTEGVVPPTRLVPSAPRIAALLRRHGLTVHVGSVISTDNRVNDTVRDRLAMTRALIADRESAWLLAACGKVPIACVRVAAHRRMHGWRRTARTLRIVSATLTEWASS